MAHPVKRILKATYDFSVDGGAVGAIDLVSQGSIPVGSIISSAWTDARTTATSAGSATIALAVGGVTIKAATAMNDAAYTGIDEHVSALTQTTSTGGVTFTIATAALTAGVMDIYVEYIASV